MLLLYRKWKSLKSICLTYLHSTMLLLYQGVTISGFCYLTFTFHYASTLSGRREKGARENDIYIPLCFYFIRGSRRKKRRLESFTFHYASTLSAMTDMSDNANKNLHSTMLLLYRFVKYETATSILIYIPLCFYFIQVGIAQVGTSQVFTFHYASTLS